MSTLVCLLAILAAPPNTGDAAGEHRVPPSGGTVDGPPGDPAIGFELLTTKPYLKADFDDSTIDSIWKIWPAAARDEAAAATDDQRRDLIFERYGFIKRPGDELGDAAAGYVHTDDGWHFSCFACHAGSVAGQTIYGLPNSHIDLQSLSEDSFRRKLTQLKMPYRFDLAAQKVPLSDGAGGTNAVMFGIMVGQFRDRDLNLLPVPRDADYVHHNHDAPPWWHAKHKSHLYIDGFAPKTHRPLVQFTMSIENDGATVRDWATNDCRHILAYIESLDAPEYPFAIDEDLADEGRAVFEQNCASCHGTYDERGTLIDYPEVRIPIDDIGTDRVRLNSLTPEHRGWLGENFLSRYGRDESVDDPGGYVAPPLTGVWATAPYLHNGSVPTLWHMLHPAERPALWRRTRDGYDRDRVGLEIETFERLPTISDRGMRRKVFDASGVGKSIDGHDYPNRLQESEKRSLLEFLKRL